MKSFRIVVLGAALLGGAAAGAAPATPSMQGHNEIISQIDLRDVTVGDALRILSEETGLNIVASEKASKIRTALYLRNARPREILQTIARTYNLWYQEDPQSHIIRLYTADEFRLGEVDSQTERTEIFTLRYPNPIEVAYSIRNLYGDRVQMAMSADQDFDTYQELQQRFRRFDIVNSRSQTLGTGTLGGGASTSGGGAGGGGMGGGGMGAGGTGMGQTNQNAGRGTAGAGSGSGVSAEDLKEAYGTGEALKSVGGLVSGAEGEGKSALGEVYRKLSPIYVTVIRNQNRLLIRTRDPQALDDIRDLVKKLDVSMSTLLMEVKLLSVDLTDQFDSVFNFAVTAGSFAGTAILPGASQITGALVAKFVNDQFTGKLDLLEKEGRVTTLATPMLMTTNQEVSRIFVGQEQPVTTGFTASQTSTGSAGFIGAPIQPILVPTTSVVPVGTTMLLTPNINADRSVSLRIVLQQSNVLTNGANIPVASVSSVGGESSLQQVPVDIVQARTFSGTIVTKDQVAVAVGGLIEENANDQETKVPLLGDIPWLGALFREVTKTRQRRELIAILKPFVTITPVESAERSKEFMNENSVHPSGSTMGEPLDMYRNPARTHRGYELQDPYKTYPGQDSLDKYRYQPYQKPPRARPPAAAPPQR